MSRESQRTKSCLRTSASVLGITALVLILGLVWVAKTFDCRPRSYSLSEIQKETGTGFPANSRLLHSYGHKSWGGHGDGTILAVIEVTPKGTQALIQDAKREDKTLSRTHRLDIENALWSLRLQTPRQSWWNPDSVQRFIAISPSGFMAGNWMLIGLDDPQHPLVFFYDLET